MPPLRIVIDDASHASRHQQDAFLNLFPIVEPGGLYVIEDLDWQPPAYERKNRDFSTTAHLLGAYLATGKWMHSKADYVERFRRIEDTISAVMLLPEFGLQNFRDKLAVIRKAD